MRSGTLLSQFLRVFLPILTAHERLNKIESAIFVSLVCSLLSEDLYSVCILCSLQLVLCRQAAVKRLP